jgi:hypothetical protein
LVICDVTEFAVLDDVSQSRPFPVDGVADKVEQGVGLGRGGKIQNLGALCRADPRVLSA